MPAIATDILDGTLHYLVVDFVSEERIFVFLDRDPGRSRGPTAVAVTLHLLPGGRLGSPVDVGARPILGQDPDSSEHFREFRSFSDLMRANYTPVACYRVCESWDDYMDPWRTWTADGGSTDAGSASVI